MLHLTDTASLHLTVDILDKQLHPMEQTLFPSGDAGFQYDKCPFHTDRPIKSGFKENEDEVTNLPWPSQSPNFDIIEPLMVSFGEKNPLPASSSIICSGLFTISS
ncbi:hypothetical protein AVEN_137054-1, partial [Araneus ventricosus]